MSKNGSKKQGLTSAMLILLLLLSGCGMASELFVGKTPTETPMPAPTRTAAPTITPTITPTTGLPPEIAAICGEEVPELTKNEKGVYTAENAFWKAIYENGEWRVRPRPHSGFDEWFLEAVGEKYLSRDNTPGTWSQMAADLIRDPAYDSMVGYAREADSNAANKIHIEGRIIGCEWVSLEGQSNYQFGDKALVIVVFNSNYPDKKIPVLMGIEKDGRFTQATLFSEYEYETDSRKRMIGQKKADFDKYVGREVDLSIPWWYEDPGWGKDMYFRGMADLMHRDPDLYNLFEVLLTNPDGYLIRYTNIKNSPDYQPKHGKMVKAFIEVIDSMNTQEGGDIAFFTYSAVIGRIQ